jgi:hypothetical protein
VRAYGYSLEDSIIVMADLSHSNMPRTARSPTDRTVTRSFRISERALKSIEDEAKRQNVSLSTLINQQLVAYSDFDRYIRRLGLIKISSATFERLLAAGPDSEIAKAGFEAGSDVPSLIILAKYGVLSLDTVIDYLRMLSEFAHLFEFGRVEQGSKQIITLVHNLGPKGSIFFDNYVKAVFDSIHYSPKISSTVHSVVLEVIPEKMRVSDSF